MGKKIAIVILVIVAGLMLGVILSGSLAGTKIGDLFYSQPSQIKSSAKTETAGLNVRLAASPSTIKAAAKFDPVTELEKIEKTTLSITYENKTSSDLSGVEVWITSEGGNSTGVATITEETKYSKTKSKENVMVFQLPDLPKNSSNTASIYFFVRPAGDTIVYSEIKTKEEKPVKSNSVIIKSI